MAKRAKEPHEYSREMQALGMKILTVEDTFDLVLDEPVARKFQLQIYNYRNAVYRSLEKNPRLTRLNDALGKATFSRVDEYTIRVVQEKPDASEEFLKRLGLSASEMDAAAIEMGLKEPEEEEVSHMHFDGVDPEEVIVGSWDDSDDVY